MHSFCLLEADGQTESLGSTGKPIKQELDVCRRVGY